MRRRIAESMIASNLARARRDQAAFHELPAP